jgi:tetraacyldisaccharide 4'-kinase
VRILAFFLLPISWLYGSVVALRNLFYQLGFFEESKVSLPVISVGNLSVGGTGKTPHVDWIIDVLKKEYSLGILMRGYGRSSKGFVRVTEHSRRETVGDEALMYKKKQGSSVDVAVCESRVEGAKRMLESNPILNCIILDDAFQHRAIIRNFNILLTDYNNPFWKDFVLPAGRLREFSCGKNRADVIVVTKCPTKLTSAEKEELANKIKPNSTQKVFFSSIRYGEFIGFKEEVTPEIEQVILVTGIADASTLKNHLEAQYKVEHVSFPDHHNFSLADVHRIHQIFDTFATENKVIVTTSKDRMRLLGGEFLDVLEKYPWFYQDMRIQMEKEKEFITEIKSNLC